MKISLTQCCSLSSCWEQAQKKAQAVLGQRGTDALYRTGNMLWLSEQ